MLMWEILKKGLELNASDIILSPLSRPSIKVDWDVVQDESFEVFSREDLDKEILSIMSEKQRREFVDTKELDFGIDMKWYSRFRVNAFIQRDGYGVVFRPIKSDLPTFEQLGVPPQVLDFTNKKHWLILVTGSVWSWKSTTLAALLKHINATQKKHIITIEDPVEFIHKNDKSLVEQREVWSDTHSFENGLKYALRQASDVILVWEMRDLETFRLALRAAETGNLVLATLHTSWAARTVSRIIDMFPWDEKELVWLFFTDKCYTWNFVKNSDWRKKIIQLCTSIKWEKFNLWLSNRSTSVEVLSAIIEKIYFLDIQELSKEILRNNFKTFKWCNSIIKESENFDILTLCYRILSIYYNFNSTKAPQYMKNHEFKIMIEFWKEIIGK